MIKLCAIPAGASPTEVRNSFQALGDETVEEGDGIFTVDAPGCYLVDIPSAPRRWNILPKVARRKQRSGKQEPTVTVSAPSDDSVEEEYLVEMSALIEVTVDPLNGVEEEVE